MPHPIRALLLSSVTGLRNRPPTWHWVVVSAVALAAGIATYGATAHARHTVEQWGATDTVFVTTEAIQAGVTVDEAVIQLRQVPSALVPAGAVRSLPVRALATNVGAGEILVEERFGSAVGHLLASNGWRAVAVERTVLTLDLRSGDTVEVVIATDLYAEPPDLARQPAPIAHVLRVNDTQVVLALPTEQAAEVAIAAARHQVHLLLVQ
jgi:hypothetical protein